MQDAQKGRQQGRNERRGEEVPIALCAGRSPVEWILANGKDPPVLPTSDGLLLNVELLSDARTPLPGFFSILLRCELQDPKGYARWRPRQTSTG